MAHFDKELFEAQYRTVSEGVKNALTTLTAARAAAGEAAAAAWEETSERILSLERNRAMLQEESSRARAESFAPHLPLEQDLRGKLQAARKLLQEIKCVPGWGDDCPVGDLYLKVEGLVESLTMNLPEEVSGETA